MTNAVSTDAIATELVRIIHDSSGLTLGLCQVGTLESFLGTEDLSSLLPAVLVKPAQWSSTFRVTGVTNPGFECRDDFRILYVEELTGTAEPVMTAIQAAKAIVSCLANDTRLESLNLTPPVEQSMSWSEEIEWDPPEDRFMMTFKTPAKVTAIKHVVTSRT